jgi:hypothetical protein
VPICCTTCQPLFVAELFLYERNIGCICSFSRLNSTYKFNYFVQMYTKICYDHNIYNIHHLIFSWMEFITRPIACSQGCVTPPVDASHHLPQHAVPTDPTLYELVSNEPPSPLLRPTTISTHRGRLSPCNSSHL